MSAPAFLRPSAAEIWQPCPGAPSMWGRFPGPASTDETEEGTAAHEVVGTLLTEGWLPEVGTTGSNGVPVTQEMIDGAMLMLEEVKRHNDNPRAWRVEQYAAAPWIHAENRGTPDLSTISTQDGATVIVDYKYGHLAVRPDCWQIIDYAAMLWTGDPGQRFRLIVVQPRCYTVRPSVRSREFLASELSGSWGMLKASAELATGANPPLRAGKHCRYCSARMACPALSDLSAVIVEEMTAACHTPEPEMLGKRLEWLEYAEEVLKAARSGVREEIITRVKAGENVPGWQFTRSYGREKWEDPALTLGMGMALGLNLAAPESPLTPAQARDKMTRAGHDFDSLLGANVVQSSTWELSPVDLSAAKAAFKQG